MTPLVVSASVQMLTVWLSSTQKHQTHMSEAHLDDSHQVLADDNVLEVKLHWISAQSVAQPVLKTVATRRVASHGNAELVESFQTDHRVSEHLALVP